MLTNTYPARNPLAQDFHFFSLLRFAAPTIGNMLIFSLYTVVDGIFVARFTGSDSLAAVNLVWPAVNLIIGVSIMFAAGGSAVVGKTLGEKQPRLASERFTMLVVTAGLIGAVLGALGLLFIDPILHFLGTTSHLWADCHRYLFPMLLFAPITTVDFIFDYFFVTSGRPMLGLYLAILSGLINIGLDYVFLAHLGFGVSGAAWATVIAYTVSALIGFWYFRRQRSLLYLRRFTFQWKVILQAMKSGSAEMVTQLAVGVTTFLFNLLTLRYAGENGIAAITIILYAEMLLTAFFLGFTSGIAPIFSYHHGARNPAMIRRLLRLSLTAIAIASLLAFGAAQLFAEPLVEIFVPQGSEVELLAASGLQLFALSFLACGFNIFTQGFFTALSQGHLSALGSCARGLVGISFFLITLPPLLGINGIWLAVPAADASVLLLSFWLLRSYLAHQAVKTSPRKSVTSSHEIRPSC